MKKLALALVASTVAIGSASANIGTGFYLGADVGVGSTTGKATSNGATGSVDVGGTAANIGIFGGYGWVTGCLYFGGEIGYTFENAKVSNTLGVNNVQFKRNGYFDAALRGGYLFTPNTMLYVRLGGRLGKFSLNSATPAVSGSKNRLSFAPGFGLETAIHKNVYLRVEYAYEFGPSVRASNGATFVNVGTVRNQSGKIGLAYKF
jgi:opacity protein-like surface antigen